MSDFRFKEFTHGHVHREESDVVAIGVVVWFLPRETFTVKDGPIRLFVVVWDTLRSSLWFVPLLFHPVHPFRSTGSRSGCCSQQRTFLTLPFNLGVVIYF